MNRFIRNSGFYLILFLVVVGIVQFVSNSNEASDLPRYDQLRQEVKANNISKVTVQFDGYAYLVTGAYKKQRLMLNRPIFPYMFHQRIKH